jgi:uncharacterized membrane protein YsdA (DUF1294 family)
LALSLDTNYEAILSDEDGFLHRGDVSMTVLGVAYLLMNIIGLVIMRIDKTRAKRHQYRISEKTLWLVAIFGGAIGTTVGMKLFRHKTKHASFKFGFPLLAITQIILLYWFLA